MSFCGPFDLLPLPTGCTGSGSGSGSGGAADCTTCTLLGLTPSMNIPDGTGAGDYTGTAWADSGSGLIISSFGTPTGTTGVVVFCQQSTGQVFIGCTNVSGSVTSVGSVDCGPPVVMTFAVGGMVAPNSCIGSTGNVVVTT
jgi:hypothetical protein